MAVVEGPLSKWTNVMKGWQYRWFVLDEAAGLLSYFTVSFFDIKPISRESVAAPAHWSGWAPAPVSWIDSHLVVKCLNGYPFYLPNGTLFRLSQIMLFLKKRRIMFSTGAKFKKFYVLDFPLGCLKKVYGKMHPEVACKVVLFLKRSILFKVWWPQSSNYLLLIPVIRASGKQLQPTCFTPQNAL